MCALQEPGPSVAGTQPSASYDRPAKIANGGALDDAATRRPDGICARASLGGGVLMAVTRIVVALIDACLNR
jgi:hypothetical protein